MNFAAGMNGKGEWGESIRQNTVMRQCMIFLISGKYLSKIMP